MKLLPKILALSLAMVVTTSLAANQLANEKTAINLLYSGYDGWVSSNGEKNKDWYKK